MKEIIESTTIIVKGAVKICEWYPAFLFFSGKKIPSD